MERDFFSFLKLQIVAQGHSLRLVKQQGQFLAGRQVCQQCDAAVSSVKGKPNVR